MRSFFGVGQLLCDLSFRTGPKLFQKGVRVGQPKMTPKLRELHKGSLRVLESPNQNVQIEGKQLLRYSKPLTPETTRPQDAYKLIDTNMEAFFNKRAYSIKNFNFYLKAVAEQKKSELAVETLDKMKALGINPNRESYIQVMTACAKTQNVQKVEEIFRFIEENPCTAF